MKAVLFLFILGILLTPVAFCQEPVFVDSLGNPVAEPARMKPGLHYSVGSSFSYIPRYGSVTGLNASAFFAYPLTPGFTLEGGLVAGRYYPTLKNFNSESGTAPSFNTLSMYGSARYQVNRRLSVYGTGMKQLAGAIPLYNLPSGSFSFGSTLDFGNFSFGAEIRMTDRNYYYNSTPIGGNRFFFPSNPW